MFTWLKAKVKEYSMPKDPMFARRAKSEMLFGAWRIVEIGANDYAVLLDLLNSIHLSDTDNETKGKQIVGLRYCALAMSLRTKSGRIPLNYNQESDLLWLGTLPFTEIEKGLTEAAKVSDIPWLEPKLLDGNDTKDVAQSTIAEPTQKELLENPC